MTPFDFDALARLAWAQIWQVTVVALVVGIATKLWCRDRPRLAYALWMLVVVKSMAPPVWSSPTGLFSWAMVDVAAPTAAVAEMAVPSPVVASNRGGLVASPIAIEAATREPSRRVEAAVDHRLAVAAFSIWAAGAVVSVAFVIGRRLACSVVIRRSRLPVDDRFLATLTELSRRLGMRGTVRLLMTSRPIGPAVFGLFRPTILLPEALAAHQPLERVELILAHELIHVRRGDLVAGALQLVAQLVWWFHPLIWWANAQASRVRERCCDEEVLSGVGCKPALYARTLLSVLEQKALLRSLVALPGVRALEVTSLRLESIMKSGKVDHRRASLVSRLAFVAGAVVLVPGMGLTLRAARPSAAISGQFAAVEEAPNARAAVDDGAQPAGSPSVVRPDSAFERLGNPQVMLMLTHPATQVIRKALRITDDQMAKITEIEKVRNERPALVKGKGEIRLTGSPDTYPEQIAAFLDREAGKALIETLTPPQIKRLDQIVLTSRGVMAFRYLDVQKDLHLTAEQEGKINAILEGLVAALRDLGRKPGGQPKNYEGAMALEAKAEPLRKGAFEQILALLTKEQSTQWKAMIGEPFRAEEAESGPAR
ncbi:M56 family metallopeptidase [Paludisphaera borealis]|uniref:Methicillin resistance mecR1 protein n=1 Tax=Paludisphaera borealis TaxID=1387353 RepID=A0A1U7CUR4_9BACT|nr:M56 family metallopeptidase [Paludisphaera borealis]APW62687.1 Methicillin resistance mecR1 protein [Paludisphaera borealis]